MRGFFLCSEIVSYFECHECWCRRSEHFISFSSRLRRENKSMFALHHIDFGVCVRARVCIFSEYVHTFQCFSQNTQEIVHQRLRSHWHSLASFILIKQIFLWACRCVTEQCQRARWLCSPTTPELQDGRYKQEHPWKSAAIRLLLLRRKSCVADKRSLPERDNACN